MSLSAQVGRVVVSKAGRDKNKVFMIVEIVDEQFVFIADGDLRRLSHPKKKKVRHLEMRPAVLEGIKEKLLNGKKVFDAELRSALHALCDQDEARA